MVRLFTSLIHTFESLADALLLDVIGLLFCGPILSTVFSDRIVGL